MHGTAGRLDFCRQGMAQARLNITFDKVIKMGWLARLFGAVPKEEMDGIRLSTAASYWEVDGPKTFEEMFNALRGWVPQDAVLYFEGGSTDAEIDNFMAKHSVPEVSHVALGTIWPRPKVFHVPATVSILTELARIMKHHAEHELAVHFHVYRNDSVLIEWHDSFSQAMLISGDIAEEKVKIFADKIGKSFRRIAGQSTPAEAEKSDR